MKHVTLGILLVFVILVSGCTSLEGLFGGDVVNVQQKVVENGEKDVIIVKDIQTIPSSPLLPDQQVLLSFILENRDNLRDATASVDLFNAPTMKNPNTDTPCNLYTGSAGSNSECGPYATCVSDRIQCQGVVGTECSNGYCCFLGMPGSLLTPFSEAICAPDQCGREGCIVLPREEKPVNFNLKTPSESDTRGIRTSTKLDFKVIYEFTSSLNYIVPAVSSEEIIKRQRSGEKIDLQQTKSYSSGPLQIDAEILGAPYLLSNTVNNLGGVQSPQSIITFKIRNRGSGTVVNSKIESGALEIVFPPELEVVRVEEVGNEQVENQKFTCTQNYNNGGTRCINDRRSASGTQALGEIPLYRDESRSAIRFTVRVNEPLTQPFRSYSIYADVDYDYELRNSVDVTINPFQNV